MRAHGANVSLFSAPPPSLSPLTSKQTNKQKHFAVRKIPSRSSGHIYVRGISIHGHVYIYIYIYDREIYRYLQRESERKQKSATCLSWNSFCFPPSLMLTSWVLAPKVLGRKRTGGCTQGLGAAQKEWVLHKRPMQYRPKEASSLIAYAIQTERTGSSLKAYAIQTEMTPARPMQFKTPPLRRRCPLEFHRHCTPCRPHRDPCASSIPIPASTKTVPLDPGAMRCLLVFAALLALLLLHCWHCCYWWCCPALGSVACTLESETAIPGENVF